MSENDIQPAPSSTSGATRGPASQHKYSFNIGSIDSFDRKMEEAQEALGFDPNEFVPITYTNELSWSQELLRLLPTLLLIGGYVWFTRRSMGSMGGGGLGGGGRGIFNVGKAQVGTVDKNAKDKIMFRVSVLGPCLPTMPRAVATATCKPLYMHSLFAVSCCLVGFV